MKHVMRFGRQTFRADHLANGRWFRSGNVLARLHWDGQTIEMDFSRLTGCVSLRKSNSVPFDKSPCSLAVAIVWNLPLAGWQDGVRAA